MEIKINADVSKFKPKIIGVFTGKQVAGFIAGCGLAYGLYALEKYYFGEASTDTCVLPLAVCIAFTFFEPRGMTLTQYIKTVIVQKVLNPSVKVWKSDYEFTQEDEAMLITDGYEPFEEEVTETGKHRKKR